MKSLASVALSLLLLASVSFSSAYAQDTSPAATDAPAAADDGTEIPPIEEQSDADVSIDDIIAGATGGDAAAKAEDDKAAVKPQEAKEDAAASDTAVVSEGVEIPPLEEEQPTTEEKAASEPVVVDEAAPASEGLETAEEAQAAKKAEEEKAATEAQKAAEAEKNTEAQAASAEQEAATAEEDIQLFNDVEGMEFSEKMPAETKELQLPGEAASGEDSVTGCIFPAGEPIEVTVPEVCNYVDIHDRRLKYKKTAAKLTASLEARRVSFEKPHFEALQNYRKNLEETYIEDSKEYQQKIVKKDENAATVVPVKKEDVKPENKGDDNTDVPEGLEEEKSSAESASEYPEEKRPVRVISGERDKKGAAEEEITKQPEPAKAAPILPEEVGVKEEALPPETDEEGQPVKGKKVVMPADAPVFDPSHIQ